MITTTDQMEDCPVLYKIQDKLLAIGISEETDESVNPVLERSIQQELSKHITQCDYANCQTSFLARVSVGLQDKKGNYLKKVVNN